MNIGSVQFCIGLLFGNIGFMQFCTGLLIVNIGSVQFNIGLLFGNISPMQFCKRALFANIDRKTFFDIAVKVVGAFASNAPLRVMVGGAHRRGATLPLFASECLSANYF